MQSTCTFRRRIGLNLKKIHLKKIYIYHPGLGHIACITCNTRNLERHNSRRHSLTSNHATSGISSSSGAPALAPSPAAPAPSVTSPFSSPAALRPSSPSLSLPSSEPVRSRLPPRRRPTSSCSLINQLMSNMQVDMIA